MLAWKCSSTTFTIPPNTFRICLIIQNDSLNNKANQLFFQYSLTKCWKTSPGLKIPFHTDEAGNMFQYHGMNTSVPLAS